MKRAVRAVVLMIPLFAVPAATAGADPLVVQGSPGSILALDFEGDFFRFAGNAFAINADNLGFFIPRVTPPSCVTCNPGDIVNMSMQTPGDVFLGVGNGTVGGVSFTNVDLHGTLTFTAPSVPFPSSSADPFFLPVVTPFTFAATIRGVDGGAELFSVALIGRGLVGQSYFSLGTGTFFLDNEGRRTFAFRDAESSSPTPEPATLLLVALGGAGALRRKWAGAGSR